MKISKEIEGVLTCDIRKKYEYFIKKVADFEEVWSLRDEDGWATLGTEDKVFFPIWPKKEYSELCTSDEWKNYHSESIELNEFIEEWIQNLKRDGIRITIMWNNGAGIDVDWEDLLNDIKLELEKY